MALTRKARDKNLLSYLKPYLTFERFIHKQVYLEYCKEPHSSGGNDTGVAGPKCVKLNALELGVRRSMISRDSYRVIWGLQNAGFKTYLVGGCVRDLLINRVPKDFDVITTAKLDKVKRKFCKLRAMIVGKRFPVCRVGIGESVVEVTTFGTIDKHSKSNHVSPMPKACDPDDFARWTDCMRRDFTINSLFYDPFTNTIFDCANAMKDLRSLKLRTIAPALQSFTEDQARILRGIRIAARLRLSLSEETEAAIHNLSSSITEISKPRLMMEVNYMLSYGAAETSFLLLKKFKLLEMLLPFQAAYLSELLDSQVDPRSSMLMKLLSQLDQLITCDQPCHGILWISLLSFHMALYRDPQPAEVVLTFASLLYHGNLEKSVQFARQQHASGSRNLVPEILNDPVTLSDGEIAKKVTLLHKQVKKSIYILTKQDILTDAMARFRDSPTSGLIFISHNMGKQVWDVFTDLQEGIVKGVKSRKELVRIDYMKLAKGDTAEVRFVLGQIIIHTLAYSDSAKSELIKHELRKVGLELENEDKRIRSPSNNEPSADEAHKGRMLRDDGDKTKAILRGKKASKSPGQNLASDHLKKDAGDKAEDTLREKKVSKNPGQNLASNQLKKDDGYKAKATSRKKKASKSPRQNLASSQLKKDDREKTKSTLSKKKASKSPRQNLASSQLKKDDSEKTKVKLSEKKASMSRPQNLAPCTLKTDEHMKAGKPETSSSLSSLFNLFK